MAIRYRERMTRFISKVRERGIKIKDPLVDTIKTNLNTGFSFTEGRSMRSTFRTEKERIIASLQTNSIYDSTPSPNFEKSFNLRPRQPEKEIGD